MKIGPIGFLFAVAIGWAGLRAVMLWPGGSEVLAPRRIAWAPALSVGESLVPVDSAPNALTPKPARARPAAPVNKIRDPVASISIADSVLAAATPSDVDRATPRPPIDPAQRHIVSVSAPSRLSLAAWAILRGKGQPTLVSAGQLGGSQTGARLHYDLGSGLAAAARVSAPLRSRYGKEAAIALDWRPAARVPLTVTVERRLGLDRGGRDAFAAGIFGGFDGLALPMRFRLDGYAQAGLVGVRHRDGYADGSLRAERALIVSNRFRLAAGAGVWGGAQPGIARLDVGPQLVAHTPVRGGGLRIGAEWRARVAGHARPGSGAALTIGADF